MFSASSSHHLNSLLRPISRRIIQKASSRLEDAVLLSTRPFVSVRRKYHSSRYLQESQNEHSNGARRSWWNSRSTTTCTPSLRSRSIHSSAVLSHSGINRPAPGTGLKVHFKDSNGNLIKTVEANEGDDVLAIAHEYDIDLEGACEGSVACSTCHVILPEEYYDLLPEPEDDENDMLDMAFGLTDTSRLGCQVKMTKELDGITCTLPAATRNMFVDGKKASH